MNLFHRPGPAAQPLTTSPTPADTLAIRITQDELAVIERMLGLAWKLDHGFGQDKWTAESPVPAMMKALRMRTGAAAAAAEHVGDEPDGTIPLLVHEVETVENAYQTITGGQLLSADSAREKQLVDQLLARLGYAQAVEHLGGHAVIRRELGEDLR